MEKREEDKGLRKALKMNKMEEEERDIEGLAA